MKKLILLSVIIVFTSLSRIEAQSDLKFSNFMFNELTFNPAAAASSEYIIGSLDVRTQWTGFPEAPKSQFFNAHTNLENAGGFGLSVINDKLGFEKSITAHAIYARKFKFTETTSLSLGAGIGIMNKSVDFDKLVFEQTNDLTAEKAKESQLKPDFNFGMTLKVKEFNFSISSTHLTQSLDKSTFYKTPRHYYVYTYYKIKVSDKVNIIPSVFVKSSEFITQFEVNTNVYYNKIFWVGATYRHKDSFSGLIGFNITKQISLGYAYDFNYGPAKTYSPSSHEIMLYTMFDGFGGKKDKMLPFFR
jgi:type IX secretion system PorP/SprF family membrane protein